MYSWRITHQTIAFSIGFCLAILISIKLIDARSLPQIPKFSGSYIAAISDGDFLASTYEDGKLPAPGVTDRLAIVPLPLNGKPNKIARINVSNSVIGAPYALALSPDRRTAFVVETLGAMPVGATRREQLPPGNRLVAILQGRGSANDLADPRRPQARNRPRSSQWRFTSNFNADTRSRNYPHPHSSW